MTTPTPKDGGAALSKSQMSLLEWLGKEDFSQHGECKGKDFDDLMAAGLIEWATFERTDQPSGGDFRWVQLTESGWTALRARTTPTPGDDHE